MTHRHLLKLRSRSAHTEGSLRINNYRRFFYDQWTNEYPEFYTVVLYSTFNFNIKEEILGSSTFLYKNCASWRFDHF